MSGDLSMMCVDNPSTLEHDVVNNLGALVGLLTSHVFSLVYICSVVIAYHIVYDLIMYTYLHHILLWLNLLSMSSVASASIFYRCTRLVESIGRENCIESQKIDLNFVFC